MVKDKKITGIKSWPVDDRPREKLLKKGAVALSNSELLAILLRTGTQGTSAIDLLGPNLFYNSPMEACILICNKGKKKDRREKILFINAVNDVRRESAFSYLTDDNIAKIHKAFVRFKDIDGFAKVIPAPSILANNGNLNIALYVSNVQHKNGNGDIHLKDMVLAWQEGSKSLKNDMADLFKVLEKDI
jgi:type I restriction enzyme M protein